ncbi:hypothetical protein MHH52_28545 [Paenibacillus sp. FSL K6-0276]
MSPSCQLCDYSQRGIQPFSSDQRAFNAFTETYGSFDKVNADWQKWLKQ